MNYEAKSKQIIDYNTLHGVTKRPFLAKSVPIPHPFSQNEAIKIRIELGSELNTWKKRDLGSLISSFPGCIRLKQDFTHGRRLGAEFWGEKNVADQILE